MLTKRLLRKKSFVALLCVIPIILPMTNAVMSQDSGVLTIALCNDDKSSVADEIIRLLLNYDGILLFEEYDSPEAAEHAVAQANADAAWIFPKGFSKEVDEYNPDNVPSPLVEVIERESSVALKLSHEFLYGALYKTLARSTYKNYVHTKLLGEDVVSDEYLMSYYDNIDMPGSIIKIKKLNSDEEVTSSPNYLTAPIRGLLCVLVLLCSLAAAMYFLTDQSEGRYDWLPYRRRLLPAFANTLSAACLSALVAFIALQLSGISVGFGRELISMLMFIIAASGFSLIFCRLFSSAGKLGAALPGIAIITIVLSPIFFNMKILRPVRLALPTYYYLQSVHNTDYLLYMAIYCVAVYAIAFALNALFNCIYSK